jgi:hypothetical protein
MKVDLFQKEKKLFLKNIISSKICPIEKNSTSKNRKAA